MGGHWGQLATAGPWKKIIQNRAIAKKCSETVKRVQNRQNQLIFVPQLSKL